MALALSGLLAAALTVACTAAGDLDLGSEPDAAPTADAGTTGDTSAPLSDSSTPQGDSGDDGATLSNGPNDICPGVAIELAKADGSTLYTGHVAGTTATLLNHYAASCGGGSGADAVYRLDPPLTGRATARITAGFSAILSVRTSCDDSKSEIACADDTGSSAGQAGSLSFPVFQGAPVFLFVDGYGGTSGELALDVDVQTAVCGNGKAESPEECDDGNVISNDGCSATCTLEDKSTTSACPGMGYRLGAGTASFAGDTASMTNGGGSATGCVSSGSGPNAIYAITPKVSGNLALSLLATYEGALLHVRRECSDNATQTDCAGSSTALVPLTTNLPVTAEQTVFVFVDGASSSAKGLYTLDATLTAASCGNGKLDSGEECDDGNTSDGDGCSATCVVVRDATTYTCPGAPVRLESASAGAVRTLSLHGTTASLAGQSVPANKWSTCGASGASDVVYQMTSDIDGWLTAKVKGPFNSALAVRAACTTTGADLACAKAAGGNAEETVTIAVNKETPYFLVVDGATTGQAGPFDLTLSVAPSVCGNGVVEGGETCDDGALADGDGCDVTCHLETEKARDTCATAPSIALTARDNGAFGATIVSGNTNLTNATPNTHSMSPCSSWWADGWFTLTSPISGVMTARITSATFRSTIGARTACTLASQITCDGTNAHGGQEITFAVTANTPYILGVAGGVVTSGVPEIGRFTIDVNVVPTGCGDTFLNPPEQCDDGNTAAGDGCSATCTVEPLANANTCPGHTVNLSGTSPAETRRSTVTVDTTSLPSNTGSVCGGSGPEGVLAITSDIDGQLSIKSTASHPVILHARSVCNDPTTEIKKSDCGASNLTSVSTAIKKNTPLFVYVDGQNGASGVSKLQITVTP